MVENSENDKKIAYPREKKLQLLRCMVWDYFVDDEEMLDVVEGRKSDCGAFTTETLFARSLKVLKWQDVGRLWGVERSKELYTPKVSRMLFPPSLRESYDELFRVLREGTLHYTGRSAKEFKKLRSTFLFNRRRCHQ